MKFQRKRVDLGHGAAEYLEGGAGPRLLFLHGASGVRITSAVEALARARRIYLPIAPGFDGTEDLDRVVGMADLANHIATFIASTIRGPADVAGHSFGGWIACWLAAQRPDLVCRLILQCPAGLNPRTDEALEGDPATFLSRAFAHPEKRRPETKTPEMIAANRARAARYSGAVRYDASLVSRLDAITCPTLILYGRKDGVVPPETPLILEKHIPRAKIVYIDDAAHNIEVDQPEIYVDLLYQFLD
ncbi:alpha/beta hydrolase [Bradyrhizobium pachyrhizi]|uniref:alpha/beta fold hydrolase n=1 Tax=Bradyrhizobium pachyrhizi TaxID=280333 RepID=UPI0024B16DDC|nr:alpha/beta hydrolase [Bradyrhizobium pachyrhizi]WFU58324.1 alpha/beta hydrolase [Bradyrhizobium pachyrhizi]